MKTKLSIILGAAIAVAAITGCVTPERTVRHDTGECVVKDGKVFDAAGNPMVGCVARFDGRMMTTTDRGLVHLKRNMRMSNGLVCLVDGTCIMQDKSKRKLEEGEVVSKEGKFFRIRPAPKR